MQQAERRLTGDNVESITREFRSSLQDIGDTIHGLRGVPLFVALKRDKLVGGPYPGVSLFEAANRIMSDLVILHGVSALLKQSSLPFREYLVEFGNEDRNGFDIRASIGDLTLVGEAFNVAPSYFAGKRASALKKLRSKGAEATFRLLMFNREAAEKAPAPMADVHHMAVEIDSGAVSITCSPGGWPHKGENPHLQAEPAKTPCSS